MGALRWFREQMAATFKRGGDPAYVGKRTDRSFLQPQNVTGGQIGSALIQATQGNVALLADIYDIAFSTDPILRGVRGQLRSGVVRVDQEVSAANDTRTARDIANWTRQRWFNAHPSRTDAIAGIVEALCRGGGLVEIIWEKDGAEWLWKAFRPVPQQRIRYDRDTGEMAFAENRTDPIGRPASSYPAGTFLVVQPDRHIPDFALRGRDRSVLGLWFQMTRVRVFEVQNLEYFGMPLLHAKYSNPSDKDTLLYAMENLGAAGRLVTTDGATVTAYERSNRGTNPYEEFERRAINAYAINYLGASQTVTIEPEAGSKASVSQHGGVREDVLTDIWSVVSETIDRDLFGPYAAMNWGASSATLSAHLVPQFQTPVDVVQTLTGFKLGVDLGMPPALDDAYDAVRWKRPVGNEPVLGDSLEPPAPPPIPGPQPMPMPVPVPADATPPDQNPDNAEMEPAAEAA